ncbi:hypothetical protein FHW67_002521 [Herbaspirillum sp. Sphag1AN]|uniref:hypothetical protein n=1 Tax=unclassified Herbaspirillum TaxID=2624150 RepID=UPI00161653B8|nr:MULTISPECIES: hypothetical protein [unclassified Herbaspirillum]MBB3213232.1 hypothetical protein [Herbaspirillum sp. Sphag1AN]MBB3246429.1 hypothetical protein [Herbaspirillum sp. Sphag64]
MSEQDLKQELVSGGAVEPLLPIEKKLIVGSLVTGIVLLAILVIANHLFPLTV